MNNVKKYSIGIDMGATSIKMGLMSKDWNILLRKTIPVEKYRLPDFFFKEVGEAVHAMLNEKNIKKDEFGGMGIGLPGCVDSVNGIVRDLTNMPYWHEVHISEKFEKFLQIPTRIDNDVNMMTIGEWRHGAGNECEDMICITLGTGVGGGLVLNGKMYRGVDLCAGEIGHIPLFYDGEQCNCGNRGCLERYVGNAAIVRRTQEKLILNPEKGTILVDLLSANNDLTPKLISEAAGQGDELSNEIFNETGKYIGSVLSGVVNLLNPERIVIGGGVAQAGELLFKPIREEVEKRAMPVAVAGLKIIPAKLGEDAGIYGAATYAIEHFLHKEF
ncbi:ROK family protein [bacterium]|nr:ROK family protein [bacterium]